VRSTRAAHTKRHSKKERNECEATCCLRAYGMATKSKLPILPGFFRKRALFLLNSFATETSYCMEPTNGSHPFEIRGGRGDTGRQRCVGCLKSNISFCKRATNYRDLLQKMTCKDKESCASSPPCAHHVCACPT